MIRKLAVTVIALCVPAVAEAQQPSQCEAIPRDASTAFLTVQLPSGNRNVFVGGGVTFRCPDRGITLVADSLESYGDEQRVFMIGNVRYSEPRLAVTSDFLTYFRSDERVLASGNVVATLPSGSTLRGPQVEYRREVPRIRTIAELEAVARPTVSIVPEQDGAAPTPVAPNQDTTFVTGNRIFMRGDSLLYASGQVDIVRSDFEAQGDSVFMDSQIEYMQLLRTPAIVGKGERPFRLTGELIDLYSANRQLDRVISRGAARAVSEDMTLDADTIQFQVAEQLLQAAFAWGRRRQAEAVSPAQRMTADSIAVAMPNQRVRRIAAVGTAYAEAKPDTARFRTTELDWLRGDTIFAWFDSTGAVTAADTGVVPPDTASAARDTSVVTRDTLAPPVVPPLAPVADTAAASADTAATRIRELLAIGEAQSYQHLPPQDESTTCPAINYVRGDSILVTFDSGQLRNVRVVSAVTSPGVLAEPDSTCGRPAVPPTAGDSVTAAPPASQTPARPGVPSPPQPSSGPGAAALPSRPARPQPSRP